MYKVYMWTNKINGKRYIGVTKQKTVKIRAGRDFQGYRGSPYFYAAIHKYGAANFQLSILQQLASKQRAGQLQSYYISLYKTTDAQFGYNLHVGGFPQNIHPDQERRLRISNTLKKQRGNPQYRAVMRKRMLSVWNDLNRRKQILSQRKGKFAGRPRRRLFCHQLHTVFQCLREASQVLGISESQISLKLKISDTITCTSKTKNSVFTLSQIKNIVDVKESELLEVHNARLPDTGAKAETSVGMPQAETSTREGR